MFTTPQLIKDKEFESKFRGFDPIEVKEYLEIIADEFFELQEQYKEQADELEALRAAKDSSEEYKSSLETDIQFTRKITEELKNGCKQKEEKVSELTAEVEELQLRIADMEQESADHDEEMSAVEASRKEAEEALTAMKEEKGSLVNRIQVLLEQNRELRKEEVDFKSTLATAQRFAEDLKAKSKVEADEMIKHAQDEITRIRNEAQAELTRLPKEIQILENKKHEVREELRAILENYLETIDVFYPEDRQKAGKQPDLSDQQDESNQQGESGQDNELFQKIEINEDGSLQPEDTARIVASENEYMDAGGEQDKKVLDSILRGDAQDTDDDLNLKEMFNLEPAGGEESS